MKLMIATFVLTLASTAFSHIEKGEHRGQTAEGTACSLIAGEQSFENNQHHPLNERIKVQVGSDHFTIAHPPVIDAEKSVAFFNHDQFQGVLPTATGAKALVVEMAHTESKEGPVSFTLITHHWKSGEASKVVCTNLEFKK